MTGSNVSGNVFENERADEAISVNGLRVSNNNFLLNGVDNNEFGLGGVIILPPPDAIQEFRTEESAMSAEFGRGGAAVNVVVKSGTNQLHGGVYEFIRNDQIDALNYFATEQDAIPAQPVWRLPRLPHRQESHLRFSRLPGHAVAARAAVRLFGAHRQPSARATLPTGLPVRAFPLAAPEGPPSTPGRSSIPYSTSSYNCPGGQIISLRNQVSYPGVPNVMSPAQILAVGQNVINLYPAANVPGIADNYTSTEKQINDQDSGDLRVDHRFREQIRSLLPTESAISAASTRRDWASWADRIAAPASAISGRSISALAIPISSHRPC